MRASTMTGLRDPQVFSEHCVTMRKEFPDKEYRKRTTEPGFKSQDIGYAAASLYRADGALVPPESHRAHVIFKHWLLKCRDIANKRHGHDDRAASR